MKTSLIRYRVADFLRRYPPFQFFVRKSCLSSRPPAESKFRENAEFGFRTNQPRRSSIWVVQQGTVLGVGFWTSSVVADQKGNAAKSAARSHLERMLDRYVAPAHRSHRVRFVYDQQEIARGVFAQILWLQGWVDQAIRAAQHAVEEARAADHPPSLCWALLEGACPIALYIGDLAALERSVAMALEHATRHALSFWHAYAPGAASAAMSTPKGGRLKSLMSTSSNSASLRFCAISKTHLATASPLRPGRVLPMMMAILSVNLSCAVSKCAGCVHMSRYQIAGCCIGSYAIQHGGRS
jgi:hypothetical protein